MSGPWVVAFVAFALFNIVLAAAVLALARQIGLLHQRMPPIGAREEWGGPVVGAEAPSVSALDLAGRQVEIGASAEKPSLLIFVSPGCRPCQRLAPAIRTVARAEATRLDIVIASGHGEDGVRRFVRANGLDELPVVVSPDVPIAFGDPVTPFAFAIDSSGIIAAKGVINHLEHLESLAEAAQKGPSHDSDPDQEHSSQPITLESIAGPMD